MIFRSYSGLDEAALGPRLGPFCAGLTTFLSLRENRDDRELYEVFQSFVSPSRVKRISGQIVVGDSKKIYTGVKDLTLLEEGALTFLSVSGLHFPTTFLQLIRQLCPEEDFLNLSSTPWFQNCDLVVLPAACGMDVIAENSRTAASGIKECGAEFIKPSIRFVTARAFNRELVSSGGKGRAVQNLISVLLKAALDVRSHSEGRITVDRQGGRRYYGPWLTALLPGLPLRAHEESQKKSAYSYGGQRIEFLVGADELRLETALASMLAKYFREIAMRLFNTWWAQRIPAIKPTAGYPEDASRFIAEVTGAGMMPSDPDLLIRRL